MFDDGELSSKKANPYTVTKNIRYEVDETGQILFDTSELLSPQQVRGLFANFATQKNKSKSNERKAKKLKLEDVDKYCDKELQKYYQFFDSSGAYECSILNLS